MLINYDANLTKNSSKSDERIRHSSIFGDELEFVSILGEQTVRSATSDNKHQIPEYLL